MAARMALARIFSFLESQASQQQQQQDQSQQEPPFNLMSDLSRAKKDAEATDLSNDAAFLGGEDPGFVQARPSREGRRYLLWRKITGWKVNGQRSKVKKKLGRKEMDI